MFNLQTKADVFGLVLWIAFIIDGGLQAKNGKGGWRAYAEVVIGILGLLADGYFVTVGFFNQTI